MINTQGYSASESLSENLYTLSRIYSDECIYELANNLRIADEDRNPFIHFIRNSICYAVSNRFSHNCPIDTDNIRENLKYLDGISLMSVGSCISNICNKIIESTMKMTRSLSVNSVLTKNISAEYNMNGKENKNLGGNANAVRSNDQRYADNTERIFKNGEYGRDNRQNQRDNSEQIGTTGRIHQGISQSDLRSDETGLLGTEQAREQIQDADRPLQGGQADKPLDGYSSTGNQLYEKRETETDESLEYRERGKSAVQGDDISPKRNDNQGSGGNLENTENIENLTKMQIEGADDASFFNVKDNPDILMTDERSGNDEELSPNFANEVDKAVDEYEMMKDEAISRIATLKLELALQYTNIEIDDFSDEQLEEIMSAIKKYDFRSNEIAEIANPRLPMWKMEQLKWLIDDMKKGEAGITSEKIKYLKALDIDIAKFNVLKGYLVRDEVSIEQIDEIKKDISSLSMSEFVENLKAYARKNESEKVAIKVGTEFILANKTDSFDIKLEDTGRKVEVDKEIYKLNRGTNFVESQKVDKLIDTGKYTPLKIDDYPLSKESEITKEKIIQSNLFAYMKQDMSVPDNTGLDLSVGTTVYMNHEEYIISDVNINDGLDNSMLVLEPVRRGNNYSPIIKFENYEELLKKISFKRPNLLIGDEVHYKGKGYTVTRFDDMRNNLKTVTINDNAEYFGGMITGAEVIAYRFERRQSKPNLKSWKRNLKKNLKS